MTIEIDEIYIKISNEMIEKYGFMWFDIIGFEKYLELRKKHEKT